MNTTMNTGAASLSDDLNPEIVKETAQFIGKITGLVPPPHDAFPPEWHGYLRVFTKRLYEIAGMNATPAVHASAAPSELREAARQFHNLTQGDSTVIIRAPSAEKRDAIIAAGERLRAAIAAGGAQEPVATRAEIEHARDRVLAQSKNSLFRSGAKICAAEILSPTKPCTKPPEGWTCSRVEGHEGPCAASPAASNGEQS